MSMNPGQATCQCLPVTCPFTRRTLRERLLAKFAGPAPTPAANPTVVLLVRPCLGACMGGCLRKGAGQRLSL